MHSHALSTLLSHPHPRRSRWTIDCFRRTRRRGQINCTPKSALPICQRIFATWSMTDNVFLDMAFDVYCSSWYGHSVIISESVPNSIINWVTESIIQSFFLCWHRLAYRDPVTSVCVTCFVTGGASINWACGDTTSRQLRIPLTATQLHVKLSPHYLLWAFSKEDIVTRSISRLGVKWTSRTRVRLQNPVFTWTVYFAHGLADPLTISGSGCTMLLIRHFHSLVEWVVNGNWQLLPHWTAMLITGTNLELVLCCWKGGYEIWQVRTGHGSSANMHTGSI